MKHTSCLTVAVISMALVGSAAADCPSCSADLNNDDIVDGTDLGILLSAWCPDGGCKALEDLNDDTAVDGTDLGILLGQWGPCASGAECPLRIVADTDRNGVITNADLTGRAAWTTTRGALYLVNVDDDKRSAAGQSDSIEFDKSEAAVIIDDKINKGGDTADVTPVLIKPIGGFNAATDQVFLKTASLDQMKAIHIFDRVLQGRAAVAGGPAAASAEVDITALVSATKNATLAIEGLKYRLTPNGYAGLPAAMLFDGFVQLTVEHRRAGVVLQTDTALLKVAPWIMFANELPLEKLFVCKFSVNDATGAPKANTQFRADLSSGLPANTLVEFTTDTQWAQDDIEFGYSQTPTSALRVAAYSRHHESSDDQVMEPGGLVGDAQWRRDLLMGATPVVLNTGHYRMPRPFGASSGEYGGNIELLPPTAAYPLGRVCHGSTISDLKRAWFKSQEVQPPFELDTEWLIVGHVDEMVAFWKSAPLTVVLASPRLAYTELGYAGGAFPAPPAPLTSGSAGPEVPDDAVFFNVGESRSGTATGGTLNTLQDFSANFLSGPSPWQFVRIYAGTGAGQTAHIAAIPNSNTLVVDQVWSGYDFDEPQIVLTDTPAASPEGTVAFNATISSTWLIPPDETSRYVVVEDTEWWTSATLPAMADVFAGFTPATLTKADFDPAGAKGAKMRDLNVEVQKKIDDARARIVAAAAPAVVTFVEVPVLYTGQLAGGAIAPRTCVGFTPGAANMVFGNGKAFVPKQKGPQWRNGAGVLTKPFEDLITAALGGAGNVVFVEDWMHYHMLCGEVHCGSNAIRKPFPFKWWDRQPAGIPPLP